MYEFCQKILLMLYCHVVLYYNQILLSDCLFFYWAIAYYPICNVMNFVISWTKSQDKNWNTIGTKRALRWKKKMFIIFKGLSFSKDINCLKPEIVPLTHFWSMFPFYPPWKHYRKPKVFWCIQGAWNENVSQKWESVPFSLLSMQGKTLNVFTIYAV